MSQRRATVWSAQPDSLAVQGRPGCLVIGPGGVIVIDTKQYRGGCGWAPTGCCGTELRWGMWECDLSPGCLAPGLRMMPGMCRIVVSVSRTSTFALYETRDGASGV
jgi:hypothetical protein